MARRRSVFSTESELQTQLTATVQRLAFDAGEVRVRREMSVGGCIPDFVLVSFASPPPDHMWPSTYTYRHACVVAKLRATTALHRPTLAERMYESEERMAPLLEGLLESGAIECTAAGALRLSSEMRGLRAQVIAIETKLARWSEALRQAIGYRRFADRVIVAMDAGLFDPSNRRAMAMFRRAGVGLCVVDRDGPRSLHSGRCIKQVSPGKEYVCSSVFLARTHALWMRR